MLLYYFCKISYYCIQTSDVIKLCLMSSRESITALFPGQGGIKPGLGEIAFHNSIEARKIFYLASSEVGIDLSEVAFGSQTDLLERNAQLVRTAASLAEYEHAKQRGLRISGAGGHSLGQLAALAAIGAISTNDIFPITKKRQEAMDYANSINPGLMVAATGISAVLASKIAKLAKAVHTNENASDQHVFSGLINIGGMHIKDRVESAIASLRNEIEHIATRDKSAVPRIKIRPLGKETGAAHTDLQDPGVPIFSEEVARRKSNFNHIKPGSFLANSVQWLTSPDDFEKELVDGLTQGVNWRGQMEEYYHSDYRLFYEPESSEVLTGLIRRDYELEVISRKFGKVVMITTAKDKLDFAGQ
jgi:[acyl-carrier-protein] S-malonyltransferase